MTEKRGAPERGITGTSNRVLAVNLTKRTVREIKIHSELLLPLAGRHIYSGTAKHRRALKVISLIRQMNEKLFDMPGKEHP